MRTSEVIKALYENFPDAKGNYPEYKICCPFCIDNRYRLGLNLTKRVGHCFNCGCKMNFRKISELLHLTERRVYEENNFQALETVLADINSVQEDSIRCNNIKVFGCTIDEACIDPDYGESGNLIREYLWGRGFDPDYVSEVYGVLVPHPKSRERGRVLLPVYENHEVVYYQARAISDTKPKYLNPSKLQTPVGKSHFVYNLESARNYPEVVICEGIFSAWSVGKNAVAIFGKELSDHQTYKIFMAGLRRVTILLDPGEDSWALKAAKKLCSRIDVRVAKLSSGDPNEVSRGELLECLGEAEFFEDSQFCME